MPRSSIAEETCPIARAIGVVGDWWTLLILRDALLIGSSRFDQFHRSLGIATNILTRRLGELVDQGLLERVPSDHPRSRYEYRPTEKGADLWPVLAAFLQWGNRWTADEQAPPTRLTHSTCGGHVQTDPYCSECGEPLASEQLHLEPLRAAARERARTRALAKQQEQAPAQTSDKKKAVHRRTSAAKAASPARSRSSK